MHQKDKTINFSKNYIRNSSLARIYKKSKYITKKKNILLSKKQSLETRQQLINDLKIKRNIKKDVSLVFNYNPDYHKNYSKVRYHSDENFRMMNNLRSLIHHAFRCYSTTGKIMKSKKYGIDYEAIIKRLGPKPGPDYEIDHIVPLSWHNFDDERDIELAFAPENHQWLPKHLNRTKHDCYSAIYLDGKLVKILERDIIKRYL